MARFIPDNEADKQALIARALKLKPRHNGVIVATEKGWATPHANGYVELLVSFSGLDALLGSATTADQDIEAEPVEVDVVVVEEVIETAETETSSEEVSEETSADEDQPINEESEETPVDEAPADEAVAAVKKKGGRPKKVVVEQTEEKGTE